MLILLRIEGLDGFSLRKVQLKVAFLHPCGYV